MKNAIRLRLVFIAALAVGALSCSDPLLAQEASPKPVRLDAGDIKLNSILVPPGKHADLPPIVFIHGASTSLYDPMFSFRAKLEGRAELLFVDRPGHGGSDFGGRDYVLPDAQADAIAKLMKRRGIKRAIVVGHSFGGAIAAELAVRHPEIVSGLVFLSPAAYPWKGGVAWYYRAASRPISGALFSTLIVPPLGLLAIDSATRSVFAPNPRPANYIQQTRAYDALRPMTFQRNAEEIASLSDWAKKGSLAYRSIKAPTVIITGDTDAIVSPAVHAEHLARDISSARLLVVRNLGHKSDYVARDLAVAAIESVAGKHVDLNGTKDRLQRQLIEYDK